MDIYVIYILTIKMQYLAFLKKFLKIIYII